MLAVFAIVLTLSISLAHSNKIDSHLIVSSISMSLTQRPGGLVYNSGRLEKAILDVMASELNFTYEVRPPKDVMGIGQIVNGTGTGALGQLMRKEVDLFTTGAEITSRMLPYVDWTYPLLFEKVRIMVPYPEASQKSNALVAIYSKQVWICIAVCAISITGILILFTRHANNSESVTFMIIGLIANQGGFFRYQSLYRRLPWAVWCLALVVLVNVYTGTLTSMLTAPNYHILANSMEDVAANPTIRPKTFAMSLTSEVIKNSPVQAFQTVFKRMQDTPGSFIPLGTDIINAMNKDENSVFIGVEVLLHPVIVADAHQQKRCRFALAKKTVHTTRLGWLLQKNSPWTEIFNKKFQTLFQAGVIDHLRRLHVPNPGMCSMPENSNSKPTKLRLTQLGDCFYLLAIGALLSLLIFLVTLIRHTFNVKLPRGFSLEKIPKIPPKSPKSEKISKIQKNHEQIQKIIKK